MFFDMGPMEMVTIIILGILIFGPDKLPKAAADASRLLRQVREYAQNARRDIKGQLGPEFENIDITDLNPRRFIKKSLMEDGYAPDDMLRGLDLDSDDERRPHRDRRPIGPGEAPPYDADAT